MLFAVFLLGLATTIGDGPDGFFLFLGGEAFEGQLFLTTDFFDLDLNLVFALEFAPEQFFR